MVNLREGNRLVSSLYGEKRRNSGLAHFMVNPSKMPD